MSNWKTFETNDELEVSVDVSQVVVIEQSLWAKTSNPDDTRSGACLTLKNKSRVDVYGPTYAGIKAAIQS